MSQHWERVKLMTDLLFPLLASSLSLVFAWLVFRQFAERKKIYQLLWAISFLLFAFATFAEFYSELTDAWPHGMYRIYYWSAATLVGIMGAGSVYLLPNKKAGHLFLVFVLFVSALMLYRVMTVDLLTEAFVPGHTVAGKAMPSAVRILSPLLTAPGGLALIGVAAWSWLRTRSSFNLLIALGGIILSASGGAARFGRPEYLYLGEMLGLFVLFIGFLKSREVVTRSRGKSPA